MNKIIGIWGCDPKGHRNLFRNAKWGSGVSQSGHSKHPPPPRGRWDIGMVMGDGKVFRLLFRVSVGQMLFDFLRMLVSNVWMLVVFGWLLLFLVGILFLIVVDFWFSDVLGGGWFGVVGVVGGFWCDVSCRLWCHVLLIMRNWENFNCWLDVRHGVVVLVFCIAMRSWVLSLVAWSLAEVLLTLVTWCIVTMQVSVAHAWRD